MKEKINKLVYFLLVILFLASVVVLLDYDPTKVIKNDVEDEKVKVATIFTGSGLGDKSFNDLIYDGLLKAQKELGVEFDYSEPIYEEEYENSILEFAETEEYDLIIAIGPEQENALKSVSEKYPNQKFTLIDSQIERDNISSIYTRWEEQAFLNGVIAGLLSKKEFNETGKIVKAGVIIGMDVPHLNEGALGFEAGYKYVFEDGEVMKANVSNFKNPLKAKEIALLMYSSGVKYIQHLAGASGLGVFSAAKEAQGYAFGIDENQNVLDPTVIISTSLRDMNKIIFQEIKSIQDNTWMDGVKYSGLKEEIIDITFEGSEVFLNNYIIEEVYKIKQLIVENQLILPKTYKELDLWVK